MSRPKKDPFADLSEEYKNSVAAMDEVAIKSEIAKVALSQVDNIKNRDEDQDLAEKKEQYKVAGEQYREATKANKARIGWCNQVLQDKGKK